MMKTVLRSASTLTICLALLVAGCEGDEGPIGPQGDEGPQGPQGPPGSANVKVVEFTFTADSLSDTMNNERTFTQQIDEIDSSVVDGGAVQAFLEEVNLEGSSVFSAQLDTLNYTALVDSVAGGDNALADSTLLSANFQGTATFTITGEEIGDDSDAELIASVDVSGVAPGALHAQHIHVGDACPTSAADTNGDGFIDVVEGVPSYGAIFVPLDDDLANLGSQVGGFPTPDDSSYSYTETEDLDALPDTLNLAGRHVVVHGIPTSATLPASVATLPGGPPNEITLPVACGQISQTESPDSVSTFVALPRSIFMDDDDGDADTEITVGFSFSEGQMTITFASLDEDALDDLDGDFSVRAVIIPPGAADDNGSSLTLDYETYEQAARALGLSDEQIIRLGKRGLREQGYRRMR